MATVENLRLLAVCSYAVFTIAVSLVACVDPVGSRWHNKLTQCIYSFPQRVVWPTMRQLCGRQTQKRTAEFSRWLCEEPNVVLQIFYLMFVCGPQHRGLGMLCFASCLTSFVAASTREPGYIVDNETVAKHENYAYDCMLFWPNKVCPTANVCKIARSKYCATTKCNIARFDHFCPWVNNAIGEENYRVFLLFLSCHAVLLCYGAICISLILYDLILIEDLFNVKFYDPRTGTTMTSSKLFAFPSLEHGTFHGLPAPPHIRGLSIGLCSNT